MPTVQTPEVKENKAKILMEIFRAMFKEQQCIRIHDVPEEHRKVFSLWVQRLGAVTLWYNQFSRNKDYSSAINAAMSLGKLDATVKPTGYVDEMTLNAFENTCSNMWEEIQHQYMRPYEEPRVTYANTGHTTALDQLAE